jgi:hypothetical protein
VVPVYKKDDRDDRYLSRLIIVINFMQNWIKYFNLKVEITGYHQSTSQMIYWSQFII